MDYADSQSGLRSVSTSIPRYTGMERGGAINLVYDDSVSGVYVHIRVVTMIGCGSRRTVFATVDGAAQRGDGGS